MRQSSYGERDYSFGQMMLTLRTTIGLTQTGLASQLGVSRNAVAQWEGGSSYPKAEHLQHVIELGVRALAFPAQHEEEAIQALWRAARQKVILDEHWLRSLLQRSSASSTEQGAVGAPQKNLTTTDGTALWTVPFPRNAHFTGRHELLDQLMQQLAPPGSGQPAVMRRAALTQAQVVKGLGGIGKTQAAVEYAYRAHEQGRYTHTLWIVAATEETLLASFAALAELLPEVAASGERESRKLVAAVLRWLDQCKEPWLLLVDNADDLSLVQPYLPLRGNGSVLLTTRASATGWLAPSLEVETMGVMEGTELLLRRAQRFAEATDEEINEAANLVVALGQFPLALDQAGAELLRLCAFLAPDAIPEELFTAGALHWPPMLQEAATDPFRFNQALEILLAFSLVKRLSEEQQLTIHRLVQVVQRERLSSEEQRQWTERVVRALNAVFPQKPQETASWPLCMRYLDQVQACDTLIGQYHLTLPEAADLLTRAGTSLRERALYTLAEPLYQHALAICEVQAGSESLQLATTLTQLGFLYQVTGRTSRIEAFYRRALAIHEHLLGPDHAETAASLYSLASLYEALRRPQEAEELALRVLQMRERLQAVLVELGWTEEAARLQASYQASEEEGC